MPYKIKRIKSKYVLVRRNGTVKSRHDTKAKAEAARNLIMGKEHGWKPSKRRKK
jgi:hypothetical protein